jgi:hypothetical protein
MKVEQLRVDPTHARELWQKYQAHRAYQKPYDAEIAAIYKRLAQGKTVIRALESIRAAGLGGDNKMPRLAIARADMTEVFFLRSSNRCAFSPESWDRRARCRKTVRMDWLGLNGADHNGRAIVPLIPVHLRPKRGLANYHILWEAEWSRTYPADPYLLRRFGGDAWLVVAAWDLTDVERAVMSQRLSH